MPRTSGAMMSSGCSNFQPPTTVQATGSVMQLGTSAKCGSGWRSRRPKQPSPPRGSHGGGSAPSAAARAPTRPSA
eukprot:3487016-Pyramimonas_sp.AAC.1